MEQPPKKLLDQVRDVLRLNADHFVHKFGDFFGIAACAGVAARLLGSARRRVDKRGGAAA